MTAFFSKLSLGQPSKTRLQRVPVLKGRNFSSASGAGIGDSSGKSTISETRPFKVTTTGSATFEKELEQYKDEIKRKLALMKEDYAAEVRPLLVPSCLILPHPLNHDSTAFVHYQAHAKMDQRPTFTISFDLMVKDSSTADVWKECIDFVISGRTYVAEQWTSTYGNIESSTIDYGIMGPPDGDQYLRGECDASYSESEGKANLSCILWDKNQVLWSEVVEGVTCSNSTVSEVLAALLLLMRCIKLRLQLPKLKDLALYSDSKDVIGVLNGGYTITFNNKDRDVFLLLRSLPRHFDKLVCVWKPRSLNFMADYLLRKKHDFVGYGFSLVALRVWGPNISGVPLFRIVQSKEAGLIMEDFKNRLYDHEIVTEAFVEAKSEDKFDVFLKIKETLKPRMLSLVFRNDSPFISQVASLFHKERVSTVVSDITVIRHRLAPSENGLFVVFDASVQECCYYCQGWFSVILAEPAEIEHMKLRGVREMDAMFYFSYRGVVHTRIQQNNQFARVRLAQLIIQGSKAEITWLIKDGFCPLKRS